MIKTIREQPSLLFFIHLLRSNITSTNMKRCILMFQVYDLND